MKRYQTSLCVSLLFVSATLCAAPAWAASWTQVKYMQTSEAQPDYPQTPTTESAAPTPAPETPKAAETPQKPVKTQKHAVNTKTKNGHSSTHNKKKTASAQHKKPHHAAKTASKKSANKTTVAHHPKTTNKKSASRQHTKEVHKTAAAHKRIETAHAPKAAKPAPVQKASIPEIEHRPTSLSSGLGNKSVAYNFCLGADNCTPTRYEMTGGKSRIMQQDGQGQWTEAKVDPVVASDLDQMARTESNHTVVRDLTDSEKSRIADHQGKMHAQLVNDVQFPVLR